MTAIQKMSAQWYTTHCRIKAHAARTMAVLVAATGVVEDTGLGSESDGGAL